MLEGCIVLFLKGWFLGLYIYIFGKAKEALFQMVV